MYILHHTLKVSDLRKHTAEVMKEVEAENQPVTVFSRSEPKIVIMSFRLFQKIKHVGKSYRPSLEKEGFDFFIDPPEEFLIKEKGLDAVRAIRAER